MDNHPYKQDEVEYVEAEPIEPDELLRQRTAEYQQAPFPGQVYYTKTNCFPCCGPVGCLSLVLLALLLFTDLNVRPIIFALSIFIIISFIARLLAPRRT